MGEGTKTLGVNMPAPLAAEVEARAASMRLSTSAYCKMVLRDHIESGREFQLKESSGGKAG